MTLSFAVQDETIPTVFHALWIIFKTSMASTSYCQAANARYFRLN